MRNFLAIEVGCRGLIDDVQVVQIEGGLMEYCTKFLQEKEDAYMKEDDDVSYIEEFFGIHEHLNDQVVTVFWGEEYSTVWIDMGNKRFQDMVGDVQSWDDLDDEQVNDLLVEFECW